MIVLIVLIASIAILYYFQQYLNTSTGKIYNSPKGPWGLPFLGNIFGMIFNPHLQLSKWSEKYGKLFTIYLGNKPALVISDPKLLKELFNRQASTGKFKTETFLLMSRGSNGILNTDGKVWSELRTFSLRSLKQFGFATRSLENIMWTDVEEVVQRLECQAKSGKSIVPHQLFEKATSNMLLTLVNGKRLEDEDNSYSADKVVELMDQLVDWFQYASRTGLAFAPWLKHLAPNWSGYNGLDEACKNFLNFFEQLFEENQRSWVKGREPRHLIDCYLDHRQTENHPSSSGFYGEWGYANSVASVSEIFIGGVGAIFGTLSWSMFYLSFNSDVQNKLREEIERVIGFERDPSLEDKSRMPYTEAVILEVLRHSSLIPLGFIHQLLEDSNFHGYSLRKDMLLIPNLYHIHHNKHIWGDPQNFRPERYLEGNDATNLKENVVAFQVGRRSCLGEPLARDFLFLMLAGIFQKITVSLDPEIPKEKYFEPDFGIALMPKYLGIRVKLITNKD